MPMTFPAHQGLILPIMRRWPHAFDALALSVGAAMPDITDTVLSFSIHGYFKQWYGHSLLGVFTLDLAGGLLITWLLTVLANRLRLFPITSRSNSKQSGDPPVPATRARLNLWSFSIFVGILSHVGFDLISHDTNLLLYPWVEDPRWFPGWWYTTWLQIRPLPMFGRSYSVGIFSLIWGLLTLVGIFLFIQFLSQEYVYRRGRAETDSQ